MKDKQTLFGRRLAASFKYAFQGLKHVIIHERNFRIHMIIAILIIIIANYLNISRLEWLFIIISIFGVLVLELVNSAVERVVDLITLDINPLAKQAKDIAATAVLLYAIMAAIIGLIILGPKLLALW
ncbi:diacylglycerol kinase family protein [Lederbergia lenta]|uniref:diacylglycerol kinase family protein n=1 Tax=Lederbergia lenta TaxID=1467 RepID=UPI001E3FD27E|nr:diacylglycerol kinase family protein [Lederbergia lenta]MCM3111383.1 diacylglycerol kinase family protein [Lederbergia lenta]MEC2325230.1 diacylglycerol kinase family protein [Lederbergia lenta]